MKETLKINKQSGIGIQIYVPNLQILQPFTFEFYTNPTADQALNIVASYDGKSFTNCQACAGGVFLYTDKKLPNIGVIYCKATYSIPTTISDTGFQTIVEHYNTNIKIVETGGYSISHITNISELQIPDINNCRTNKVPVFIATFPPASVINNFTSLCEQLIPNEFRYDHLGNKKPVYTKSYIVKKSMVGNWEASGYLMQVISDPAAGASSILSWGGFYTT